MSEGAAARRYARALLDLAVEKGDPAGLRRDLRDAVALLGAEEELASLLDHPALPLARKRAVLAAVWKRPEDDLLLRLLALLVERQRLSLLPAIERSFAEQWNRRRGAVSAEVVTAARLEPEEERALATSLETVSGRAVELEAAVEPEVLGGVLVKMDGRLFDGTVRGRLQALRDALRPGA